MKKYLIAVLITFYSTLTFSQDKMTINVTGETSYTVKKIQGYAIHIQLKEVKSDGYSALESHSFDKVLENYKSKLSDKGLDFKKFKKNEELYLYYSSTDQYNEFMNYTFVTNSQSEAMKLIKINVPGLTITNVEFIAQDLSTDEISELSSKAVKNGMEKAQKIAGKLNKKLGKLISIKDENSGAMGYSYYGTAKNAYQVHLTFEIL